MKVAKLRGLIVEKGMTLREVAEKIGMSDKTLYLKLKKGVFGTDEVQKLIELLDISNPMEIFFDSK